ncbi:unnamed protein product [Nezara viridula]|uniref:Uncharacterized protein n=1 Tax=Nezara viridula TaxID=85310 RepID=A0A9P0H7Y3_NEZVI|nr:unnamed protein product [Nezara viridula]
MPLIKEISKCRRIPKEKQSLGSDQSIDDEDSEIDEEFVKMKKFFKESKDKKFIRKLKKKIKEALSKKQSSDSSEPSSGKEYGKVEYPEPLPKMDMNKKPGTFELNSNKKPGLGSLLSGKNKPLSKPLKKIEDLGKTTTDRSNNNPSSSLNRMSVQHSKNCKKDDKPTNKMTESDNKNNDKTKKEPKKNVYDVPLSKSDRDLTKNEVEAMIRTVLKQSREEGGNADDIDDVSLGETESTPSCDDLDLGKDPEMSSTPDDLSSETLSEDEDKKFVY